VLAAAVLTATLGTTQALDGNPARGAELFAHHCAACHGPAGAGLVGPPLAKTWDMAQPELMIRSTIVGGRPGTAMIAWSVDQGGPLAAQEIEDLVAHLVTWTRNAAVAGQITPTITESATSLLVHDTQPGRPQALDSTRRTAGDPARGLAGLVGCAGAVALLFGYRRWRRRSA
jgi:mono/diheme cytochrome c family protein